MTTVLESLLAPQFVSSLEGLDLAAVRERRDQCQSAEGALSFVRRMVQGRLDIAAAALAAHAQGKDFDAAELVKRLPQILADDMRKFSPVVRPEAMMHTEVGGEQYVAEFVAALDDAVDISDLAKLTSATKAELQASIENLETLERSVSHSRKAVQEHLDVLQAEIVRRYKSGEATVDNLLK